jgi:hypothetical protein
MILNKFSKSALLLSVAMVVTAGCNAGMAPAVNSPAEVEKNFKEEDPQQQIKVIQMSPAPPAKKAELIKAIEDKYGIKAGAAPVQPGTPTPTG